MRKYIVLSNDKIFLKNKVVSSDFNDTINIIEGLSKKNNLSFFCRTTKNISNFSIKLKKNKKFIRLNLFDLNKVDYNKIFMISITPFNLLILIFLKFFNKKVTGFVYLRSDGYREYEVRLGKLGILLNI